jgi:hypothetical protein
MPNTSLFIVNICSPSVNILHYSEFLGFWTLSIIRCFQRTHDVSETGSVSILRQKRLKRVEKTPTQLGTLERNSVCYTPSSEPFRNESYIIVLWFLHPLYLGRKQCIIHDWFLQNSGFSEKKADNSASFVAGGIMNRKTHRNSFFKEKNTLGDQLYDGLQGNESCDTTSHARVLPRSYISSLK